MLSPKNYHDVCFAIQELERIKTLKTVQEIPFDFRFGLCSIFTYNQEILNIIDEIAEDIVNMSEAERGEIYKVTEHMRIDDISGPYYWWRMISSRHHDGDLIDESRIRLSIQPRIEFLKYLLEQYHPIKND